MRSFAFASAALLAFVPAVLQAQESGVNPPPPHPTLEQATLLRCSAAFAIIASEQARGVETALAYPPLQERGKEYFVRSGARLMDELGLTRESLQAMLQAEVARLQKQSDTAEQPGAMVDAVMQPCLLSLEVSGL
jgi:hypothetical protein